MADELRIGLSELLRKAMIEQDADFLKEGVGCSPRHSWRWRSKSTWGRGVTSGVPSVQDSATVTGALLGHEGRDGGAEGAKGERLQLLPLAAGAA